LPALGDLVRQQLRKIPFSVGGSVQLRGLTGLNAVNEIFLARAQLFIKACKCAMPLSPQVSRVNFNMHLSFLEAKGNQVPTEN